MENEPNGISLPNGMVGMPVAIDISAMRNDIEVGFIFYEFQLAVRGKHTREELIPTIWRMFVKMICTNKKAFYAFIEVDSLVEFCKRYIEDEPKIAEIIKEVLDSFDIEEMKKIKRFSSGKDAQDDGNVSVMAAGLLASILGIKTDRKAAIDNLRKSILRMACACPEILLLADKKIREEYIAKLPFFNTGTDAESLNSMFEELLGKDEVISQHLYSSMLTLRSAMISAKKSIGGAWKGVSDWVRKADQSDISESLKSFISQNKEIREQMKDVNKRRIFLEGMAVDVRGKVATALNEALESSEDDNQG